MKTLLERIKNVNDYTDVKEIRDLKQKIDLLNKNGQENKQIFIEAKRKGL